MNLLRTGVLTILHAGIALSLMCCSAREERNLKTRVVSLAEFAPGPVNTSGPSYVAAPPASGMDEQQKIMAADITSGRLETPGELAEQAEQAKDEGEVEAGIERQVRLEKPGDKVVINSLVGQINGRPIFADEFFAEIEDRILAMRAEVAKQKMTVLQFRNDMEQLIELRLTILVNNELFLADAFASLTPEQKTGLFAMVNELQAREVAKSGGTRGGLEEVLANQGMTYDELRENKQNSVLIEKLVYEKIRPRVIVSWRDVEREYERNRKEFNPPAIVTLGRIRLSTTGQAELIEQVKARFANGASFAEVVEFLKLPNKGVWGKFESASGEAQDVVVIPEIKAQLKGLTKGQVTQAFEIETVTQARETQKSTLWIAVLDIEQPPSRSLYDSDVQLMLTNMLTNQRSRQEEDRYVSMLREQWVEDDLNTMRRRLLAIGNERYMR